MRNPVTELAAIAERAFVFAYPLVLMERIRRPAPVNTMIHSRSVRECPARRSQPPNVDVLRSAGWLDLRAGPVALSVPETHGRYYVVSLVDMWADVFASVGARTTGTGSATFAITGPRGNAAAIPPGMKPIAAPTDVVLLMIRTQADGDDDDAARAVQDGFRLDALAGRSPAELDGRLPVARRSPVEEVEGMGAAAFFAEAARLMRINPPHAADRAVVELVRDTGLLGRWDELDDAARNAAKRGVWRAAARVRAQSQSPAGELVGDWRVSYAPGRFATDYLRRAGAARAGTAADHAPDEVHALVGTDAKGRPLSGDHRYVLRFAPDAPPPVNGFWSLTAYADGQPVPDCRSIGDRDGLAVDLDGSLRIRIQRDRPARGRETNWLPAPAEGFQLVLRMYWPRGEVLLREWAPPAVTRVDA